MRKLLLTLVGGFCGAIARYALGAPLLALTSALPGGRTGFPFDILLINLSGALALGFLFGMIEHGAPLPSGTRLAVGSGFLGAYTTFSSYVVGVDLLVQRGNTLAGGLFLIGSMVAGVSLTAVGFWLAGALWAGWRRQGASPASATTARFGLAKRRQAAVRDAGREGTSVSIITSTQEEWEE